MQLSSLRPSFLGACLALLAVIPAFAQTDLLISQYYEGASNNKFIELHNPTSGPISMNGYALTLWSNATSQNWKVDNATLTNTSAILALDNITLEAGQYYLIAHSSAAAPSYAVIAGNRKSTNAMTFNGDDSVVLWKQAASPFLQVNLVDAFCVFTSTVGLDRSYRRISNDQGYSLVSGVDSPSLTAVWESTPTVVSGGVNDTSNVVAAALAGDTWQLMGQVSGLPPVLTAFSIAGGLEITPSPAVTLNFTATGDNAAEYQVATDVDFTGAVWLPYTGSPPRYLLQEPAGLRSIYFKIRNASGTSVESTDFIDYQPPTVPPSVAFTQYYEGANNNKYVEITNLSDAPVEITGWRIVTFTNSDAPAWAVSGAFAGSTSSVIMPAYTLAVKETIVIGNTGATSPVAQAGLALGSGNINFNGNDSVVLYSGSISTANVVDAFSFTNAGNEGLDKSYARIASGLGYSFATGAPVGGFPAIWAEVSLATVDTAADNTDANHLGTYFLGTRGYTAWTTAQFVEITDPLIIGFNADPDQDGVVNGLEHLFATSPNEGTSSSLVASSTAPGSVTLRHRKLKGSTDVVLAYEWSSDLLQWQASGTANTAGEIVSIAATTLTDQGTYTEREATATLLAGTPPKVFLRIRATKP